MVRIHAIQMLMIAATVLCLSLLPMMSDKLLRHSGVNDTLPSIDSPF